MSYPSFPTNPAALVILIAFFAFTYADGGCQLSAISVRGIIRRFVVRDAAQARAAPIHRSPATSRGRRRCPMWTLRSRWPGSPPGKEGQLDWFQYAVELRDVGVLIRAVGACTTTGCRPSWDSLWLGRPQPSVPTTDGQGGSFRGTASDNYRFDSPRLRHPEQQRASRTSARAGRTVRSLIFVGFGDALAMGVRGSNPHLHSSVTSPVWAYCLVGGRSSLPR